MHVEPHLGPRGANYSPLSPVDFLDRAVSVFPNRQAVIWRDRRFTYGQFGAIVQRMADLLETRGIGSGDVVSIMCPNRPEMLAAHYAVPLLGATLNSVNTRLDESTVSYILEHSESRLLICDETCEGISSASARNANVPLLVLPDEPTHEGEKLFLLDGPTPPVRPFKARIEDEWHPIALNYTSGTTGKPKGVVLHHRGAYLNGIGNTLALGFDKQTVYLWTLPMFHCNGWCHTWAITAAGGTHVCLEKVDPELIFELIGKHGVTHMSCAPVVLYMLINHPARSSYQPTNRVSVATGGAAPTRTLIAEMDALGFDFIHLYGLTESYGPSSMRELEASETALPLEDRASLLAQQGSRHPTSNIVRVVDKNLEDVPFDGETIGEIVLQGNTLLAGYYRDPEATETVFEGGVFHTGDLAVRHPDGHVEIKDRSKDIIISGGENISSLEVEGVLHQHPAVLLAAVVALPDSKWGEIPCAVLELKPGASTTPEELEAFCRSKIAGFKIPGRFIFQELPKTATGKIQKFMLREELSGKASG